MFQVWKNYCANTSAWPDFGSRFCPQFNLRSWSSWICFRSSSLKSLPLGSRACTVCTVKSSHFVILSGENIFFRRTFLRLPTDFFRYWNLYRRGLDIDQGNFDLLKALGLENLFFRRVTKLGYWHLISSPPKVCKVTCTMRTLNRGCKCSNCLIVYVIGKITWIHMKLLTPCMSL